MKDHQGEANNENGNDCKLIGMMCSLDSNNIMVVVGMLAMKSVKKTIWDEGSDGGLGWLN